MVAAACLVTGSLYALATSVNQLTGTHLRYADQATTNQETPQQLEPSQAASAQALTSATDDSLTRSERWHELDIEITISPGTPGGPSGHYIRSIVARDDQPPGTTIWNIKWLPGLDACGPPDAPTASYGPEYTEGDELAFFDTLHIYSHEGRKICFAVRFHNDVVHRPVFQASPLVDTVAPEVTVSPGFLANSWKAVDADDEGDTSWERVLIDADGVCDATIDSKIETDGQEYTEGTDIIDDADSHDKRICFRSWDTFFRNRGYGRSDVIHFDAIAPVISVSSVTNNQVSASASDTETSIASLDYQLVSYAHCDDQLTDFQSYDQSVITLAYNQAACFKATDTAGNTSYSTSEAGQDFDCSSH